MLQKLWNELASSSRDNKRKSTSIEEPPAKRHEGEMKEDKHYSPSFGKVVRLAAKAKPANKKERGLMRPSVSQISIKKMGVEGI